MSTAKTVLVNKETFLRVVADLQGIRFADLAKGCGRNRSTFHRWLKGDRTSAPLERYVGRELGLRAELLRKLR